MKPQGSGVLIKICLSYHHLAIYTLEDEGLEPEAINNPFKVFENHLKTIPPPSTFTHLYTPSAIPGRPWKGIP